MPQKNETSTISRREAHFGCDEIIESGRDMHCGTAADSTKLWINLAWRVQNGRSTTYLIESASARKGTKNAARGRTNTFLVEPFNVFVMSFWDELVRVPNTVVIPHVAESPLLKPHPSKPSRSLLGKGDVDVVYKGSERQETQIQKHKSVRNIGKERPEQDWRHKVKIAHSYFDLKDDCIEMICDFPSLWEAELSQNNTATHLLEPSSADVEPIYSRPRRPNSQYTGQKKMKMECM